jgi:hypothetical protein
LTVAKKRHYLGGSSLEGIGKVSRARGRSGGIGESGLAIREHRKAVAVTERAKLDAKINANQKIARKLGRVWAAEKGQKVYNALVKAKRVNSSPLAAALEAAFSKIPTDKD